MDKSRIRMLERAKTASAAPVHSDARSIEADAEDFEDVRFAAPIARQCPRERMKERNREISAAPVAAEKPSGR
jgi:hypothetical protein